MLTDQQINDQQMNVPTQPIPIGHLSYEFIFDKKISPNLVMFRVYKHDGDQAFGSKMPLPEWKKFVELLNRFDKKLIDEKMEKA